MKKMGVWVVIGMLAAVGCGKDRTVEDWQNEKVGQDLTKFQSVSGTYRGMLGGQLGVDGDEREIPLILDLRADTKLVTGTSASSQQKATLKGTLTLADSNPITLSFVDGFVDPTGTTIQINTPVALRTGHTWYLDLNATLKDGALNGRIEVVGFAEAAGVFTLIKDGPLPVIEKARGLNRLGRFAPKYSGQALFTSGTQRDVVATLVNHPISMRERFADIFSPVKYIDLNFEMGGVINLLFTNCEWDMRAGTLLGMISGPGGAPADRFEATLTCLESDLGMEDGLGWSCNYRSNNGSTFRVILKPARNSPFGGVDGSGR